MIKIQNLRFYAGALAFSLVGVLVVGFGAYVHANPSFFIRSNGVSACTSTATTSTAFMTPGVGTTTVTFDTACAAAGSTDSATLLAQLTASSTLSQIQIAYEYSQDNVDWYQSNLYNQATSSASQSITTPQSYAWVFASTTPGLGVASSSSNLFANRQMKLITVPTPTRYVRASFAVPIGSANATIWAEFVAKRQAN